MPVTPNSIVTPQTPRSAAVIVNTAQTTFPPTTSPSGTALLVTAGANGGRLTRLTALPHETTGGAGVMQAYRDVGTAGASKYLFATAACASDTVGAADPPVALDFGYSEDNPLMLQANERIYVATGIAKNIAFIAEWADY
jgi:hypothetical protein